MKHEHAMPFGVSPAGDGIACFRLWAPAREQVTLELLDGGAAAAAGSAGGGHDGAAPALRMRVPMSRIADGWHEARTHGVRAGALYRYRLDADLAVPDPASRSNPLDVHGPSEVVDPGAYEWRDAGWRGRPWHEAAIYELHVGTFTPEGSFAAAAARLDELRDLGITAIEVMPVAAFPGGRNWGYDGVLPYAPDASYGRPEDLKRFVDLAHQRQLMVLLDVVYNHFGPEGNYLHAYAPQFFDASRNTPWGAAIDFDGASSETVRTFFVHNALYWIEEYRFDGLRLDAVHAIEDRSSPDLVESIAQAVREGPGRERHVHLVLENDRNEARYLARDARGTPLGASAQWNDDLHHAWHVLLTGERDGYYSDYAVDPVATLGRALAEGFVYQGQPSGFRSGAPRGEPSAHLPPSAFVAFLQTHDQVGNRAHGERIEALADPAMMPSALACLLLGPQVPMLFMGEEYAASTPFLYFCDFGDELADAVRNGRREEFGRFEAFRDSAARAAIPDPNAAATFSSSKLQWREREVAPHRERLALVRTLLGVRASLAERLGRIRRAGRWNASDGLLEVRWRIDELSATSALVLRLNLSDARAEVHADTRGVVLFSHGAAEDAGEAGSGEAGSGRWTLARGGVLVALEPAG